MKKIIFAISLLTLLIACNNDDNFTFGNSNFTVTVQNVLQPKEFFSSVPFPTGLITPGTSEEISFNAGKNHYLSFVTMFVQSNDLFYAFEDTGIALYDASENPTTGDITNTIKLWDAGTEVNETPGMGPNQAPRQTAANTGVTENGTVTLVSDSFTYPTVAETIKVTLTHNGGTLFTLKVENVSNTGSLASSFSPGVLTIHDINQKPLFTSGVTASEGLEDIAEDGMNTVLTDALESVSGYVSTFAPGTYAYGTSNSIFTVGQASSAALELLAEDGNPSGYTKIFNTPVGTTSIAGPIFPLNSYSFSIKANEEAKLYLATMLVQSNDWFIGIDGLALFNNGIPISGDITSSAKLFDAGTEADEYAGAGNKQPVRQATANSGTPENELVAEETAPGSHVPSVANMIKITITPYN